MQSYWEKALRHRINRRHILASGAGAAASAAFLVACGGKDEPPSSTTPAALSSSTPSQEQPVDTLKGEHGGTLVMQQFGDPGGLVLVKTRNAGIHQFGSLTHSGLYAMANGRPEIGVDPTATTPELDAAAAMPEQPDELTYVIKLKDGIKFQNGRALTSEDVKYSFERYAFDDDSAYKSEFTWLDKVDVPSADTAVITTKTPYADTIGALTARDYGLIMAKEHEESPEATSKLMGSGPFVFVERQEPIVTRFKSNPDFYDQPYPYFDEVQLLGTSDSAKRVADFISGQTDVTYWFAEEQRDEIAKNRPDATLWPHQFSSFALIMKVDRPPFNDKRVRQALSMAINRPQIRDAVAEGSGEEDNCFTWVVETWGFRKPAELGDSAAFWEYNLAEAKKLLSAANVSLPIKSQLIHWDPTVIGQGLVDTATLIETGWSTNGLLEADDKTISFADGTTTTSVGNFDGIYLGPHTGGGVLAGAAIGNAMRSNFWSPPDGPVTPSRNSGSVFDPKLSALLDKQMGQLVLEERKQTFRDMEELMADEQYRVMLSTVGNNYFNAPSVKNIQIPLMHVNASSHYVKYWWKST
jgi:ABC-type transport system substrate-binding protein